MMLILNGKSAGDEPLREAVLTVRESGVPLQVRVTWESGDAARHVQEALDAGVATVIAAGGDGTLSEVATALARSGHDADALPSVGLVPMGTANDFAAAAGIPADDAAAALQLVREAPPTSIDLLRICLLYTSPSPRD